MKNATKGKIIKASAVAFDVAVPFVATLTQFPVWIDRSSSATVSGLFLIFAFLSTIPFINQIKAFLKSPSVWIMWIVLLIVFIALRNIIDEMLVVCFAGAVSGLIGAGIYKVGGVVGEKPDEQETEKGGNE